MLGKIVLFTLFFSLSAWATSAHIRQLQELFYHKVIVDNIYKERFASFLKKNCQSDDTECQKMILVKLQHDISIENDKKLQQLYEFRLERTLITHRYWENLERFLQMKKKLFTTSQFVTFIDLSKQHLLLLLWHEKHQSFYLIGSDLISSGNIEKEGSVINGEDHYLKTPAGVFSISSGWRSTGKRLANGITLPYGQKDRFVYYFGKQKSKRYQTLDDFGVKYKDPKKWTLIEDELAFAIHAHKSETYFGKPFSHGCVRMSNELNLFMDNNLVLHKKVLDGTKWISRSANPPKSPKNYDFAGEYLIIVDHLKSKRSK